MPEAAWGAPEVAFSPVPTHKKRKTDGKDKDSLKTAEAGSSVLSPVSNPFLACSHVSPKKSGAPKKTAPFTPDDNDLNEMAKLEDPSQFANKNRAALFKTPVPPPTLPPPV